LKIYGDDKRRTERHWNEHLASESEADVRIKADRGETIVESDIIKNVEREKDKEHVRITERLEGAKSASSHVRPD